MTTPSPTAQTAQKLKTEMAKELTLDEFFVRSPQPQSDDDLRRLIAIERDRRALFISKGETTRKSKDEAD